MINITLPDGSQRQFNGPLRAYQVAEDIGAGLARAMIAAKVNEKLVDASTVIEEDAMLSIITDKDPEGLEVIRHSTAHLMAHAVKRLFPLAQVTIGPVIEDGFYYDFACDHQFTPEDLIRIEEQMKALAKADFPVSRQISSRDDAISLFEGMGEHYKAKIIADIPVNESLSLYKQDDFIDLCRGPHVPSTGKLKAFKLMKLAGAYWRGNSDNEMLQRIYGTAWANKEDLKAYLYRLEEAEKRDHRKLAKKMDLFHIQPEAPGMIFWHPKGWTIYQQVRDYIRRYYQKNGYQEVGTPVMIARSLLERSGHWGKFGENGIFTTQSENREYAIRPMNCPCHVAVYNQGLRSYRDLPLRLAEFGSCHRNEASGTLHGLMRVRNLTQDDGHIFCTEDQIQSEVAAFIDHVFEIYSHFGFTDIITHLSTRPETRIGDDAIWDKAEDALTAALNEQGIEWRLDPGEGAFYGPKIDFHLKDCIGRVWQCGTMQLDFYVPGRLDAHYIAEDGSKQTPIMLHRAILGSLERFIGILLEHYAGNLPTWLAPVQVIIMNISDQQVDYVKSLKNTLEKHQIRVQSDLRNEKISYKIREHSLQRVPFLLVIGDKEVEEQTVTVRNQAGENLGTMPLVAFIKEIFDEEKAIVNVD